jgi:hypothetical protein
MTAETLEARIQRLEDRNAIVDVVIAYATSIDKADWVGYASTMTDPVHVDVSEAGMPPSDFSHEQLIGFASQGLDGWTARQHISPNHRVVFDDADPDKATCFSYMYAQHYKEGAQGGDFYLMRGSYDNYMVRTDEGWKITGVTQHISWVEGNANALHEEMQV